MRRWEEPGATALKEPERLRDESSYTYGLNGYRYFNALRNFKTKSRENKIAWENRETALAKKNQDGVKEKRVAISQIISELEKAEKVLLDAGSKPFAQMYPDVPKRDKRYEHMHSYAPQPKKPLPYDTSLSFNVPELNDIKKTGYIRLFEAAWDNDLEKVKTMTLAPWQLMESSLLEPPLKIAVQDDNGFSPFSIAVLRGHRELARKIVEICMAQYHKDDGMSSRQRWTMRTDSDDEDCEDDHDNDEGTSLLVCSGFSLRCIRTSNFFRIGQ